MRLWMSIGAVAAAGAIAATGALGGSSAASTATAVKPTLAVLVIGGGRVTSKPAGISCPGKCKATFAAATRVVLTPTARKGSQFLRWGGNCSGTRACRVKVSALSAVAAQFVGGSSTQPAPTTTVDPGTYSGSDYIRFYVPAGARSVQNFYVYARVNCVGGGAYVAEPTILTTTIKQNRSFTARTSERAVVGGANATITSTVTGRFQGRDSSGRATAAGNYRADIVFADTPGRKCTSNERPWTATRSLPPAQGRVESGSYSGSDYIKFYVPAGARSVQNFYVYARVNCAGGGAYVAEPKILTTTIKQNRSFTARTSERAVVGGANATITSTVTGYFQGPDSSGRTTAAGVYRADIVFADTPGRRCTSNDRPWTATRTGN